MSAAPEITQAEMDKYFESGGKEQPAAIVEAEKQEVAEVQNDLVPRETEVKVSPQEAPKETETKVETKEQPDVQVQVEGKMVPLSELLAERKNRQAWEQTAAQQQQQLSETLKMLKERAALIPAEAKTDAPDPETDPQGYAVWEYNNLRKQVAEQTQWRQHQEQLAQQNLQIQQAANWATAQEQEFAKSQPKYQDAYKFASEARAKEYAALGYNPQQIQQALSNDNASIINLAIQQGKNPAQLIWDYAQAKGYQIVAAPAKVPDLDDKVKTIERGQKASKSLSNTGGGTPTEINNLQDLMGAMDDMSDDEFSKAFDKLSPKMKGKYV